MANREKVLEKFSSKFKTKPSRSEDAGSGRKVRRDFDKQRQAKMAQWEDTDEER